AGGGACCPGRAGQGGLRPGVWCPTAEAGHSAAHREPAVHVVAGGALPTQVGDPGGGRSGPQPARARCWARFERCPRGSARPPRPWVPDQSGPRHYPTRPASSIMDRMTQTPPDSPLRALFEAQHAASRAQVDVPLALRRDRLARLRDLIDTHAEALSEAVEADFGVRSRSLTEAADLFVLRAGMAQLHKELPRWMKRQRVRTPFYLLPAKGFLQPQPLGVVGVIGPWNYPLQLTLGPAATALAAGNRVMLKPSELTPQSSALMASLVHQSFAADEFCVVQGASDVAQAF